MKYSEIKNLTVDELTKKKIELREELFHLRMKNTLGHLANPLEIRAAKRNVARIETALNEKLNH